MRLWWLIGLFSLTGFLCACGDSGSSSSTPSASATAAAAADVQPISVNLGLNGNYANGLFTSVTVCVPGTSTCQTLNDILVDTGSYGLRILAPALTLSLPVQTHASGNPIGECAPFIAAFTWGPVATADVHMSGETASNMPLHVIGAANFPAPPADCPNGFPPPTRLAVSGPMGF